MSNNQFSLSTIRHSTAHLMAAAIKNLYPNTKFGIGPDISNGFFYDIFIPNISLKKNDLDIISNEMNRLQSKNIPYEKKIVSIEDAIQIMEKENQPYKLELLHLVKTKGTTTIEKELKDDTLLDNENILNNVVSLYQTGDFIDLCRGPHVDHTGQTGYFKLYNVTAAYWRGDSKNDSLSRIYGLCYNNKEELEKEEKRILEMHERDHRKLGEENKIFFFEPNLVGSGLPFWNHAGAVLRLELEKLAREYERKDGYFMVNTPILAKKNLYYQSGHLPFYRDSMYNPMEIDNEEYFLRPMNCPHHHLVFKNSQYSYRMLPVRIAEYGQVFRYEASGALSGLMRTRGFCQNDAHIYCTKEQAKECFLEVMHLHRKYYEIFGIEKFYMRLSLPDLNKLDKYVDDPQQWRESLKILREAMNESNIKYEEVEGEAAFYGPKVDFQIVSSSGTEYTLSTNQLDFLSAQNFDLNYQGADGKKHPVLVIHRAPLGSHERFIAVLIEHYKAKFPTWLSPLQVKILYISDDFKLYADKVYKTIFNYPVNNGTGGFRVQIDHSEESLSKKIKMSHGVPYLVIVGQKEEKEEKISVRLRNNNTLTMTVSDLLVHLEKETNYRKDINL